MHQTRLTSAMEAMTNTLVGLALAVLTQMGLFPVLGIALSFGRHVELAGVFTLVSLVRSYLVRRLFERLCRDSAV